MSDKQKSNIVHLVDTTGEIPADGVLKRAIGKFKQVVIIGVDEQGEMLLISSITDMARVNLIIDKSKNAVVGIKL